MSLKNALGGIALIAGTAIGAAVLALPISTAHLGLWYTLIIYLACWFFMLMGALYLLEVNLWVGYGTNLFSMASRTLGSKGKYLTLAIYLILLYALTAAYLTGTGAWVSQFTHLNHFSSALIATTLTLIIIGLGTAVTDWVNRFLMVGLIAAFTLLIIVTYQEIQPELLLTTYNTWDLSPIPIIITAFGSAIVIPSLTEYLQGKPKQLLAVICIGSVIPLFIYVIWEFAILGIIPLEGSPGLLEIQQQAHPATELPAALERLLHNRWITQAASYFSIFALVTSLLGVCLSLFDFLADSLHLFKTARGKIILSLITFLPPLIFLLFFPQGFVVALSFAGLFVALLLGILPALMVWRARYHLNATLSFQMPGGKILILLTLLFFIFVMGIECFNQYHHFNS